MENLQQLKKREIMAGFGIACLFLLASFGSDQFSGVLQKYIGGGGMVSMALYVMMVVTIVTIPFASSLPFIPIAATVWGNIIAAGLTFLGWLIGCAITFYIGRKFGRRAIKKLVNIENVENFSAMIPRQNLMWSLSLLGLFSAPVDMVSYAVSMFTKLRFPPFIVAFGIGLLPSAFFFAYTTTLSLAYQTYVIGFLVVIWLFLYAKLKEDGKKNKKNILQS